MGLKTKITLAVTILVVSIAAVSAVFFHLYLEKHLRDTVTTRQLAPIPAIAQELDGKSADPRNLLKDPSSKISSDANSPAAEGNAPLSKATGIIMLWLAAIIVITFLAAELLLKHLLAPLRLMAGHLEELPGKKGRVLGISAGGEIGTLVRSFNRMVEELDQRDCALEKSEELCRTISSERRMVEEAQLKQLHLLRTLIDALPSPIFYKDAQGLYLGCNKAFEVYTGLPGDKMVGKSVFDLCPEELAKIYYEADNALFQRPGVQCYETRVRYADGTLRDVMFYKSTFWGIDGSLGGLVGTLLDITERKKAEDALRASEEKFRLFFEESRDAIFVADQDGRLTNANQSATEMFGYAEKEIIGVNVCETFCDLFCKETLMGELKEKGYVREVEVGLRRKDGTTIVCLLSASLRKSEMGEVIGFQGIFHDITKRKKAEEVLVRQNEYLAALNETTKGLMGRLELKSLLNAIINRAGALMKTNHSFIYLLDRSRDRMIRESSSGVFADFFDFMIKKDYGLVGKVWETGIPMAVDDYQAWSGRLPDPAREVLRAMVGIPLKSGEEIVGVIGLAYMEEGKRFGGEEIDILNRFAKLAALALDNAKLYKEARDELQERKRAEEELRKLFHAVVQSPVSVVITNTAGEIEYVNPKFTGTTGFAPEEVMGKNLRDLKSEEIPAAEQENFWKTVTAGEEWRGEFHNRKKSGELYWELASISPIRNGEGVITHFIAVMEEITERKQLENQLRQSQKMDAIGKLAGGIAHDFNNIMTAIIGYATILDMKLDREGPFGNSVKQILLSAKKAAGLTEGLLAFSRKQATNPRPVKLNDIVRRVEKILERLIGEDIELISEFSCSDPVVMADPLQIEQVLMNLATNARDAMPAGGRLKISTDLIEADERFAKSHGLSKGGPHAKLRVSDTGTGMDEDTAKKMFDPFFTTKEVGKGTGLGLSIVYGIVERHNGSINCYSEPGIGSTFTIFVPVIQAKVDEADPEAVLHVPGGSETILMAEDDGVVRAFARELLEEYGYTCIEAVDGEEAVTKFREHRDSVQLLIFDLIMPKKNGSEAYEEIRALKPDIKVIFSSGYEAEIIQKKGKLAADLNYLAKPVTPERFLSKIRGVLDS